MMRWLQCHAHGQLAFLEVPQSPNVPSIPHWTFPCFKLNILQLSFSVSVQPEAATWNDCFFVLIAVNTLK